jgi:hypothetical protein
MALWTARRVAPQKRRHVAALHIPFQPSLARRLEATQRFAMPRLPAVPVLLFGLVLAHGRAADAEFVRVWPAWRDAQSFDRIGEYFGRPEANGRETVLRTQANARDGYYFLVRMKSAMSVPGAKFELNVIRPDLPDAKTYTFASPLPDKEAVFELGITGSDWPGGKEANPVAWRIAVLDANGRLLAEHKSFLWEKPAK